VLPVDQQGSEKTRRWQPAQISVSTTGNVQLRTVPGGAAGCAATGASLALMAGR
jgi:hypothetical protein